MYPYNHQGETDSQSHIVPGPHSSQSQFIATLSAQLISMRDNQRRRSMALICISECGWYMFRDALAEGARAHI